MNTLFHLLRISFPSHQQSTNHIYQQQASLAQVFSANAFSLFSKDFRCNNRYPGSIIWTRCFTSSLSLPLLAPSTPSLRRMITALSPTLLLFTSPPALAPLLPHRSTPALLLLLPHRCTRALPRPLPLLSLQHTPSQRPPRRLQLTQRPLPPTPATQPTPTQDRRAASSRLEA